MLEQLEKINWANLNHAYGSAGDVPNDIINLSHHDKKTRDQALYNLYGTIFHQGTRYEATPYAIPFIYELLENKSIENKHKIITFLVRLALGYEEEYLPEGINPEKFRLEILESDSKLTPTERTHRQKYGYSNSALIDCYNLVKKGLPILHKCIESDDRDIRLAAVYASSWFPEEAEISILIILKYLNQSAEIVEISTAILAIGLLHKQAKTKVDISFLHKYLNSDSELIRACTAIALASNPLEEQIIEILIKSLKSDGRLNHVEGIRFNEGRITGYICITLSTYGKIEKERIVPLMCQVMKSASPYEKLDITYGIMLIINDQRAITIKDDKLENLSALEITALKSIHDYGAWSNASVVFINYVHLLSSLGLPDSKEKLKLFLKLATF